MRVELPEGVRASPISGSRGLSLRQANRGPSMRVLPIGLTANALPTERGGLEPMGREIVLTQQCEGKRCWLPLLVSSVADTGPVKPCRGATAHHRRKVESLFTRNRDGGARLLGKG